MQLLAFGASCKQKTMRPTEKLNALVKGIRIAFCLLGEMGYRIQRQFEQRGDNGALAISPYAVTQIGHCPLIYRFHIRQPVRLEQRPVSG